MAHVFTVGDLLAKNLTAFWMCQGCQASGEIDLPRLAREKGRAFTFMNRHPPCRRECGGRVFFYVRGGMAVHRQTTPDADLQALRDSAAQTARALEAKGYSRVDGHWVAPGKASRGR
jgi:hypothetical protein